MKTRSGIGRLGAVAAAIVFLLACSTPTQAPPVSSGAGTASTKPYGSLVVAWSQPIYPIDPMIGNGVITYGGWSVGVFDSLTSLDPDGNITPSLAERWEIADDGLSQTFYLRKGLKFHDGSDLTAADVKFSMERMLGQGVTNPATSVATWRSLAPQVELKDDYTVVIRFKTPQFDVIKPASDGHGVLAVVPKRYIDEKGVDYFRKNYVGSGPWKVVKLVEGQEVELEANESYWDNTKIPKFKNLTIRTVSEESTKVAMLKTGEADMADVSPDSAKALKAAGVRIKVWNGGQQAAYAILYDIKNPTPYPLSDVRVRKATSLAINRQEVADKLFSGYAEPGILFRVQPTFDFFDANLLKADPYDPDGAKKLLAEAGYPNGFDTKIWDNGGGGILTTFVQALAGYWRRVGINAAVEPIDATAIVNVIRSYSDQRVWNTLFATGVGASVGGGIVGFDIAPVFQSKTGFYRNHTNQKLDELIDKYPQTKDPAAKKQIARDATIVAKNEYSAPSVLMVSSIWALSLKIGDLTPIQGWGNIGRAYATMTHAK